MTQSSYSFGDSARAASRLKKVADVFAPEMTRFLKAWAPRLPDVVVEVGCGPGYTTRLLNTVIQPKTLWGLDLSEQFISMASNSGDGQARFLRHDVTSGPMPVNHVDLIFCHFLLSHLADPVATLGVWSQSLAPSGLVLVDETEAIHTNDPILRDYLSLVERVVANRGGNLYVGPVLNSVRTVTGLTLKSSAAVIHEVDIADAAEMFSLNLETLRADPMVGDTFDRQALDRIAQALDESKDLRGAEPVTWTMRQIVFQSEQ